MHITAEMSLDPLDIVRHNKREDVMKLILETDLYVADVGFTQDLIIGLLESFKADVPFPDEVDRIIVGVRDLA